MIPVDDILARLDKARRHGNYWTARCPAHNDTNPSFSLREMPNGLAVKCFSGCTTDAIAAALGVTKKDFLVTDTDDEPKILDTYPYIGADGELLFEVVRMVPKEFRQRRPKKRGEGWVWNLEGVQTVPYRLPELREAIDAGRRVFLVEGEQDADRLEREGLFATTTPMGAANWKAGYAQWFEGANIAIVPDNDPPGRKYATTAADDLAPVAADVRIVTLDGLPNKGDVSDWLRSHTADELDNLAQRAPAYVPESGGAQVATTPDAVTLEWPNESISVIIDRIGFAAGNVHGEIAVTFNGRRLIAYQRVNLQSGSQQRELFTALNRGADDKSFPWHDYIGAAINRSVEHFRTVGRFIDVATIEDPGPPTFLVGDLWPDMGRPSLLYGDSESAKSVIATCLATSVAAGVPILGDAQPNRTGPVGYLDWEDDEALFRHRLGLISASIGVPLARIPVRYHHPRGPLYQIADSIAREIEREGIIACVIDSRGPAQSGSLSSDDDTNRFFDAIDGLGCRILVIDHLDKATIRDGGEAKHSFGSVFTRGRVVSSWRVKANHRAGAQLTVTLTNAKWNHGQRQDDRSYVIDWSAGLRIDRRAFTYVDPERSDVTATDSHLDTVYDHLIRHKAGDNQAQIARATGLHRQQVSRAVTEGLAQQMLRQDGHTITALDPADWPDRAPY